MGILFALPLSPLSGECRENVNRHAHMYVHTHAHARMHTPVHKTWICNGGIRVGALGSQKVYVTQDIRDKSLEAQCETHTHTKSDAH